MKLPPDGNGFDFLRVLILAIQTGCLAPGYKLNVESTNPTTSQVKVLWAGVLLPLFVKSGGQRQALRFADGS